MPEFIGYFAKSGMVIAVPGVLAAMALCIASCKELVIPMIT